MARLTEAEAASLRALDLFERLIAHPGKPRFRERLLRREPEAVLARLAALEAGHAARAALPTQYPKAGDAPLIIEPPSKIGPYRLAERIGMGGMGEVWRAERADGLFEQAVAIKLLHPHLDDSARAAFDSERRTLARLTHPSIVRITDGGTTDSGLPYLIMEHVAGAAIDHACAKLPADQRIRLFRQLCDAVQAAHAQLIAHGDLKPSNILVDLDGRVRLLDFGISALVDAAKAATPPGAMTQAFASPERLAGAPPSISDDVFALGKVLGGLIADDPEDPDLAAIVRRASAETPADRYATVAALAEDIDRFLAGEAVQARDGGWRYRAGKFVGRHQVAVAASALAIAALTGLSIAATVSAIQATRARNEAVARFEDARGTSRYLLFTLMDRLEAQPHSLALRSEVARVAQFYLDRLSRAPGADPAVRVEAALGLIRLAQAQGLPGYPNLSRPADAHRNLDQALGLLAGAPGDAASGASVSALIAKARLANLVDQDPKAAFAALEKADAVLRANPKLEGRLRGVWLVEQALALENRQDYPAMMKAAGRALEVLPSDPSAQTLLNRSKAFDLFAEAQFYAGDEAGSAEPYRHSVETLERAWALHPESLVVRQRLARQRWALASTLTSIGRDADGLKILEQAREELAQLLAFDGDDMETVRLMQINEMARGQALAGVGRVTEAAQVIRANVAARRAWAAKAPSEMRRGRDYVVGLAALAELEVTKGMTEAGCETFRQYYAEVGRLARTRVFSSLDITYSYDQSARLSREYCPRLASPKKY